MSASRICQQCSIIKPRPTGKVSHFGWDETTPLDSADFLRLGVSRASTAGNGSDRSCSIFRATSIIRRPTVDAVPAPARSHCESMLSRCRCRLSTRLYGKFPYDSNNPQKRSVGGSVGRRTLGAIDDNRPPQARQLTPTTLSVSEFGIFGVVGENFGFVARRFGKDFWNRSRDPVDEQGEEFRAW